MKATKLNISSITDQLSLRAAIYWTREGGGGLGLIFAGYVLLASQSPYPIIVYSVVNIIIDPVLLTFGQTCNFCNTNLVTSYFYELQPPKLKFLLGHHLATNPFGSGKLFYKSSRWLQNVRCHSDQNSHNLKSWIDPFCLTSNNPKMCDPILETLLKLWHHPAPHPISLS